MTIRLRYLSVLALGLLLFTSCKDDDDPDIEPPRDRSEEAEAAMLEIEAFLETHFYNYEDFEAPPADFDYRVVFDTIAGENANKTPLIEQVSYKEVADRNEPDVMYKLYYLNALQGEGETPMFADRTLLSYKGYLTDKSSFDGSDAPVLLDLAQTITGFQQGLLEFQGASNFVENEDGTVDFENFGAGAVFIPSGLGYFNSPPANANIPFYSQLIFTFQLYDVQTDVDHDEDGIISYDEDLNNNNILNDDDTDENGVPNYLDDDDDGDGVDTIDEIIINEDGTVETPDSNGNGTPDYLDPTFPNS